MNKQRNWFLEMDSTGEAAMMIVEMTRIKNIIEI